VLAELTVLMGYSAVLVVMIETHPPLLQQKLRQVWRKKQHCDDGIHK
jgi:hypothetical protein